MAKNLSDLPEKLRLYIFHGVDLDPPKTEWVKGDCPFCGKESHFFVSQTTGKFKCQRCKHDGNQYGFLNLLLRESLKFTKDSDYEQLAEDRKPITIDTLKSWHVAKSFITGEWLLPAHNVKGSLANLYKAVLVERGPSKTGDGPSQRWAVYSSPGCKTHPFGRHLFPDNLNKIIRLRIQEGPWDGMAVWQANKRRLPKYQIYVLATPGTNSTAELKPYLDGTFREPRKPLKRVDVCFDNDHGKRRNPNDEDSELFYPGFDGQQAVIALASEDENRPDKLYVTDWCRLDAKAHKPLEPAPDAGPPCNDSLPDGFDARDLLRKMPKTGLATLDKLLVAGQLTSPTEDDSAPSVEPLPCKSFDELLGYWDKARGGVLYMTPQIKDTLLVALATVISTPLGGDDQLWFRIIGPPGSAKSTIAEAISVAKEYVFAKSILRGFHSGYTGGGRGPQKDASLVPQIRNKTVCMKDADTLTQSPAFATIMSELRDIYDKVSRASYRNKQGGDFEDLPATFLLCGTDHLRANTAAHNFLGERFLDIEIAGDEEVEPILVVAQDNEYQQLVSSLIKNHNDKEGTDTPDSRSERSAKLMVLKQRTYGFLQHFREGHADFIVPAMSAEAADKLRSLAKLLACLRARVHRDGGDLIYRPRKERATRLSKQLTRLAVCCALILAKDKIDEEVMRVVRKVVHDTACGFQYELLNLLAQHSKPPEPIPRSASGKAALRKGGKLVRQKARATNGHTRPDIVSGLTTLQIGRRMNLPETNIRRLLSNLQELKLVARKAAPNNSGQRGRDIHLWTLSPEMQTLFAEVES